MSRPAWLVTVEALVRRGVGIAWSRLPLSQTARYRVQRRFPTFFNALSGREEPPPHYERPAPRPATPPVRSDERALGHRVAAPGPLPASPVTVVALHAAATAASWVEVARARPQFEGHVQPRLPAELGCYDGHSPEVLERQVALARAHGVSAFAFRVDVEGCEPLDAFVEARGLELSFCVLVGGTAARMPASTLFDRLTPSLRDHRRLREGDRTLVLVESPDTFDESLLGVWRATARGLGLGELALVAFDPAGGGVTPGFDFVARAPLAAAQYEITARQRFLNPAYAGVVYDARRLARVGLRPDELELVRAGGDDEPTRPGHGVVLQHASPRGYRDALRAAVERAVGRAAPLVFVDSWNDWRRGAVLEPDARLGHAYLMATRSALVPPPADGRLCAVVHVYYVELLDELAAALRGSRVPFRVIVTTPHERVAAVRKRLAQLGLRAEVEPHENRGRDVLPFLRVADRLLDEGAELVVKLHTKRSSHRNDGERWRAELLARLLAPERAPGIRAAFARDGRLGCVAPEGHILRLAVYWGWNENNVRYLCTRMGVPAPDLTRDRFVAGSMFWVRLQALRPLLDAHLGEWEFEPEGGHIDGTMAHAIERAFALAVGGAGFRLQSSAEVCGIPFDHDGVYAYAEPAAPVEQR
jgi:hypothetical protein